MSTPDAASSLPLAIALGGWLLTLVLAVIGWIRSASDRRKAFRLEVVEHARREVVPHVAAYQDWIGEIVVRLSALQWIRTASETPSFSRQYVWDAWSNAAEALRDSLAKAPEALRMFGMLEDYEVVFPQTREVRLQLVGFHVDLAQFAHDAHYRLLSAMPLGFVQLGQPLDLDWLDSVKAAEGAFYDIQALTQDIRVGIQNAALADVFDSSVPERAPRDTEVPLIVTADGTWRIRNALPALPDLGVDSDGQANKRFNADKAPGEVVSD